MNILITLVLVYILARTHQEHVQLDKDHQRVAAYFVINDQGE